MIDEHEKNIKKNDEEARIKKSSLAMDRLIRDIDYKNKCIEEHGAVYVVSCECHGVYAVCASSDEAGKIADMKNYTDADECSKFKYNYHDDSDSEPHYEVDRHVINYHPRIDGYSHVMDLKTHDV